MFRRTCVPLAALWLAAGCGDSIPSDIEGYQSNPTCLRINQAPIASYEGDPHRGSKNVFVCNVELGAGKANVRPFPDGTIVIKESRREGESFTWLVATARKQQGRWRWDEYTRNFDNEDHERLLVKQNVCSDCHQRAATRDMIFTPYDID